MKFIALALLGLLSFSARSQNTDKNPWAFNKNDIAPMALQFTAGYAQGWREEVLYHPKELFEQFPNLNRNFWDNRINRGSRGISILRDANHLLKFVVTGTQTASVVIKVSDWKDFSKKNRWKKLVFDLLKYYGSYKVGFYFSYNITHGNKFTL
jgi:hypothetical protein